MQGGLRLKDFRPKAKLVAKESVVKTPRAEVIDAHLHLGSPFGGAWDEKPLEDLLTRMDEARVVQVVDLDGGWGEDVLDRHLKHFKERAPERFKHFGGVDWSKWAEKGHGFGDWAAQRLLKQAARGAEGLKIWKPFGLTVRDARGELVAVDDARLDPLWQAAAERKLPVIIHVADPVAFFDPITPENERLEELERHPDWHFPEGDYPTFMTIITAFERLMKRHKDTTFIGAHVGCYAENLAWVGRVLDECPNFFVDISARLGELGRQPYTARKFFIQYAERILFGTDGPARLEDYRLYYRFLETDDEYFNYNVSELPLQGRWHVYGLHLPDEVLQKVYHGNARRVLGQ